MHSEQRRKTVKRVLFLKTKAISKKTDKNKILNFRPDPTSRNLKYFALLLRLPQSSLRPLERCDVCTSSYTPRVTVSASLLCALSVQL